MDNNIVSHFDPSQAVVLSVLIIVPIMLLTLILAWVRSKRDENSKVVDVDWDEERKKLEALAAEKLAKRQADERAASAPKVEHVEEVVHQQAECEDEDAGDADFSDGGGI